MSIVELIESTCFDELSAEDRKNALHYVRRSVSKVRSKIIHNLVDAFKAGKLHEVIDKMDALDEIDEPVKDVVLCSLVSDIVYTPPPAKKHYLLPQNKKPKNWVAVRRPTGKYALVWKRDGNPVSRPRILQHYPRGSSALKEDFGISWDDL
jgi:hypothetical protein